MKSDGRFRLLDTALAVGAVAVVGFGGLLDLRWDAFYGAVGGIKLGCLAVAFAVALVSWRLGARALSAAACAAGAVSLAGTVALRVVSGADFSASDAFGFTEPAVLLVLLALVAWRGAPAGAVAAAPTLVAAIALRPVAIGVRDTGVIMALFLALAAVTVLGAGLTARLVSVDRRRREANVRLEQRAEFARDLHDFVAHHVTGIVVQAQGARAVAAKRPELVLPALEEIERAGAEALTSMRRMVGMLRESDEGLARTVSPGIDSVRSLVGELSLPGGAKAELVERGTLEDLPVEIAGTVHRVVMEALTNVRKHAHDCAEVEVLVARAPDGVTVRVHDDGRRRHGTGGGFGLKGLEERVSMVGGVLRAGPEPDGGWTVEAVLPAGEFR
jgi:signal transduction histidine kinase